MPPSLKAILDDLYEADPSLRAQEKDLTKAVQALLRAKPHAEPDEAFLNRLRAHVLSVYSSTHSMDTTQKQPFFRSPVSAALGGATIALLIAVPLTYRAAMLPRSSSVTEEASTTQSSLGSHAFGDLALMNQGAVGEGAGGNAAVLGTREAMSSIAPYAMPVPPVDAKMAGDMMIYPQGPITRYHYNAPSVPELEGEVAVYRRTNVSASLPSFANVRFNGVDLSQFSNLKVRNVSIKEDHANGYEINLNSDDGSIYIGQNWETWPQETEWKPLAAGDMLSDAQVLSIADTFVNTYNLPKDRFGEPMVQTAEIRLALARPLNSADTYFPEYVNVVYPLLIDGMPVWEEYGSPFGMSVSISLRNKTVTGATVPGTASLESSAYDVVKDPARLARAIERGGMNEWYPAEAEKTVEVSLGEPERVYMTYYRWADGKNQNLLVPALRYTVTQPEGEQIWKQHVIVPIVDELLVENENNQPILWTKEGTATPPMVEPMVR